MNKLFSLLMYAWLIAAIAGLIAAAIKIYTGNFSESVIFLCITFVGVLMYRVNRKRLTAFNGNHSQSSPNNN